MKTTLLLLTFFMVQTLSAQKWDYPETPKIPVYDTIFGKVYQDDYRWMEDTKDPKFTDWLLVQNRLTDDVMSKIPNQDKIISSYKEWQNEVGYIYGDISGTDEIAVYKKIKGGDNASKIFYRNLKTGKETLLFDPEQYVPGKNHSATYLKMSADGKFASLEVAEDGKELGILKIADLKSGKFLDYEIRGADANFQTINGETYLTYIQFDEMVLHQSVFDNGILKLHQIGTSPEKDITIVKPGSYPELKYSGKGDFIYLQNYDHPKYFSLIVGASEGEKYIRAFYIKKEDAINSKGSWKELTDKDVLDGTSVIEDEEVYFWSYKNNPLYEIHKRKLNGNPFESEIIFTPPQDWKIGGLSKTKDYLIIRITKNDLESRNFLYHLKSNKLQEIHLPLSGIVSIHAFGQRTNLATVTANSWTNLSSRYSLDISNPKLEKGWFYNEEISEKKSNLVAEEIEIPSHDGVMVPVSIVYDKTKIKRDGSNICWFHLYDSFGTSFTPNPKLIPYLEEQGVLYVVAHVRGGGEKGRNWHEAGKKENSPNKYLDAIAVAEWLIANRYTSSSKIHLEGGSAGGGLIGKMITYRPDLFASATIKVGSLNNMRTEFTPNPAPNIGEYGSIKDEKTIANVYDSDAYLHVRPNIQYPAQYMTAGYNDSRVAVWESAKYAAAVQSANVSHRPQLFYTEMEGGHFGASTNEDRLKELTRQAAFMLWQTGHPDFQPKE